MSKPVPPYKDAADKVVKCFGTHLAIAKALGYDDLRNVSKWANGERPFPPHHCVTLERKSGRAVTRQDMRPDDWQANWPELVDKESASA